MRIRVGRGASRTGVVCLLAAALGLAACTGDSRPSQEAVGPDDDTPDDQLSSPGTEPTADPVAGPVVADASGIDWDLVLAAPPASRPGFVEVFTGIGDDTIDLESPLPILVVQAYHTGPATFVVHAVRDDGSTSQVIDAVGEYTGEILTYQGATETVGFEVSADGPWALVAKSLVTVPDSEEPVRRYEGTGDAVVGFPIAFDDPSPVVAFSEARVTHDGEADFIVRQMFRGVLIEEVGSYDDTVQLPADGLFGLEITADGTWTVTFE